LVPVIYSIRETANFFIKTMLMWISQQYGFFHAEL
jgi:hypothetical protein